MNSRRHFDGPFGDGIGFTMVNKDEAERLARDPTVDLLPLRLHYAAHAKLRATGHAPFGHGELQSWVADRKIASSGAIEAYDRTTVNRAIDRCIAMGLLAPGSNRRCLILPQHFVLMKFGSKEACRERHLS